MILIHDDVIKWSFDVFFDLHPNKRLSKQPWGWWFETPPWSLWRQCDDSNFFAVRISWSTRNMKNSWQFDCRCTDWFSMHIQLHIKTQLFNSPNPTQSMAAVPTVGNISFPFFYLKPRCDLIWCLISRTHAEAQNIPGEYYQCYVCRWLGPLCHQIISSGGIYCIAMG